MDDEEYSDRVGLKDFGKKKLLSNGYEYHDNPDSEEDDLDVVFSRWWCATLDHLQSGFHLAKKGRINLSRNVGGK